MSWKFYIPDFRLSSSPKIYQPSQKMVYGRLHHIVHWDRLLSQQFLIRWQMAVSLQKWVIIIMYLVRARFHYHYKFINYLTFFSITTRTFINEAMHVAAWCEEPLCEYTWPNIHNPPAILNFNYGSTLKSQKNSSDSLSERKRNNRNAGYLAIKTHCCKMQKDYQLMCLLLVLQTIQLRTPRYSMDFVFSHQTRYHHRLKTHTPTLPIKLPLHFSACTFIPEKKRLEQMVI